MKQEKKGQKMLFVAGLVLGGLAAWVVVAVLETNWKDIFPSQ